MRQSLFDFHATCFPCSADRDARALELLQELAAHLGIEGIKPPPLSSLTLRIDVPDSSDHEAIALAARRVSAAYKRFHSYRKHRVTVVVDKGTNVAHVLAIQRDAATFIGVAHPIIANLLRKRVITRAPSLAGFAVYRFGAEMFVEEKGTRSR